MNEYVLKGRILTPEGMLQHGSISIKDGIISSIVESDITATYDFDDFLIAPGFIDTHVHGGAGNDFMSGDLAEVTRALRFHAEHGTTSILPTTVTASEEQIKMALRTLHEVTTTQDFQGAKVLGVHLEGPFINAAKAGGQDNRFIRNPSLEEYQIYEKLADIKVVTLAPELPNAESLINYLSAKGVRVSAGHTNATYEELVSSIDWGVTQLTHYFNAMSPFNHRAPGVVGAGMFVPDLTLEIIADGIHVHPDIIKFICELKGIDNIILITDSSILCGLPEGKYERNGKHIFIENNSIRLPDGTLKGSNLTMNQSVKNMIANGFSHQETWKMASENPAKLVGVGKRKGKLQVGMDADLIVLDDQFDVIFTMIEGRVIYTK